MDLAVARRNIYLWRVWVMERTCTLTFTLLKRRGLLDETLAAFIAQNNISPFRETQAPDFLESLACHSDPLVAAVAQFESALHALVRASTFGWEGIFAFYFLVGGTFPAFLR